MTADTDTTRTDTTRTGAADAAAAPLDLLLADAATGMLRRVNPGGSGLRLATALAVRPRLVAGRGGRLVGELARIAVGRSKVQPSRRDRRFADPAWAGNPLLRRTMQAYLAAAQTAEGVVAEAEPMFTTIDPSRMRMLTIGGRALRVSVREGNPGWPPLLLCNGIGASLELFRPFVTGPGSLMVPGRPTVLLRMLWPRRHRDPGYAARVAGELYGGSARNDPALARDLLHATTRLGPARVYYYQLISGLGWTSLPRLPKLRPPALILAGDDDPIIPLVNARIMHRLIPRSQLHIYNGGHLELAADSERLASAVETFPDADLTAEGSQR
jgi:Poly-beta-hydroxybutyrate polymerase (PhaC) N-terminus